MENTNIKAKSKLSGLNLTMHLCVGHNLLVFYKNSRSREAVIEKNHYRQYE